MPMSTKIFCGESLRRFGEPQASQYLLSLFPCYIRSNLLQFIIKINNIFTIVLLIIHAIFQKQILQPLIILPQFHQLPNLMTPLNGRLDLHYFQAGPKSIRFQEDRQVGDQRTIHVRSVECKRSTRWRRRCKGHLGVAWVLISYFSASMISHQILE